MSKYCIDGMKEESFFGLFKYNNTYTQCFTYNPVTDYIFNKEEVAKLKLNTVYREYWLSNGLLHRNKEFGPAEITYKVVECKKYYTHGVLHHEEL